MKLKLLGLIALGFAFYQNADAQNLDSGIVRNYPFNGNANDLSTFADNGIVQSATLTADRNGNSNSAYSFDGVSAYISFDSAGLNNAEFSVSIWANYNGTNPGGLIYLGDASTEDQGITTGAGNNGWTIGSYNSDNSVFNVFSGVAPANDWTHLVFVRTSNQIRLYINGVFNDSTLTNGKVAGFGTNTVGRIGGRSDGQFKFSGDLDDIRIYNRPLSDAEAMMLYQGPSTGISTLQDVKVSIYPNPSASGQSISIATDEIIESVTVYDLSGKEQTVNFDADKNTISGLKAGVFISKIHTTSGIITKKIVIQ